MFGRYLFIASRAMWLVIIAIFVPVITYISISNYTEWSTAMMMAVCAWGLLLAAIMALELPQKRRRR
jgi:hypothetical protein